MFFDGKPIAKPVSSENSNAFSPGNGFELSCFFKKTAVSLFFLETTKNPPKKNPTAEVFCLVLPQKRSTQCRGASKNFTAVSGLNICRKYSLRRRKMVGWSGWRAHTILTASWIFFGVKRFSMQFMYIYIYKDLLRKIMVVSMETVQKTYCG